jgi:hypothetical protein
MAPTYLTVEKSNPNVYDPVSDNRAADVPDLNSSKKWNFMITVYDLGNSENITTRCPRQVLE